MRSDNFLHTSVRLLRPARRRNTDLKISSRPAPMLACSRDCRTARCGSERACAGEITRYAGGSGSPPMTQCRVRAPGSVRWRWRIVRSFIVRARGVGHGASIRQSLHVRREKVVGKGQTRWFRTPQHILGRILRAQRLSLQNIFFTGVRPKCSARKAGELRRAWRAGGRDEGGARGRRHETNMLDAMIHLLYFRGVRRRPGGLLPDRTGSFRASPP